VTLAEDHVPALLARAADLGVAAARIGATGGDRLKVAVDGVAAIDLAVSEAEETWAQALGRHFAGRAA
jgi:hypothetical protein